MYFQNQFYENYTQVQNGFNKLYVGKQVVYVLTKVAETLTPVHYLENMLYKFG